MRPLLALALCLSTAFLGTRVAHAQWLARSPLSRTLADLTAADAGVRRAAAERLAFMGPHDRVAEPLHVALAHEAVPEVLTALIATLARRADESDLSALEAAWDRAGAPQRTAILAAEDAMEGDVVLAVLRAHLASEGSGARACAALVRTEARVTWLASTLEDAAGRERVVSCLASAPPSPSRDVPLQRAGLDLEPTRAREVLVALAGSPDPGEVALTMAEAALARPNAPTLEAAALALLARHAPERLSVERWTTWIEDHGDRGDAALRALLVVAPEAAEARLRTVRATDSDDARRALAVLVDRASPTDLARIAAFAELPSTRPLVLDTLARSDGGAERLAALPAAADVDLALAIAGPSGAIRDALLTRAPRLAVRALVGDVRADECGAGAEGAMCLALVHGAGHAARALETERDPATVAWLALAAGSEAVDPVTVAALVDERATRVPALGLVPASLAIAAPAARRTLLGRLVRLAIDDDDELARAEAVRALGCVGGAVHRATLLHALEDPSAQVRLAAARGLARVGADGTDLRVAGRTHVETDDRVLAALRGEPLVPATMPLHVTVIEHDPAVADHARVTVLLADGRSLSLPPVDGELLVPDVPDAPAVVRLGSD